MSPPLGSCPMYQHSKSGFLAYYLPERPTYRAPGRHHGAECAPNTCLGRPATRVIESKTVRSPPRQCPQGRVVPPGKSLSPQGSASPRSGRSPLLVGGKSSGRFFLTIVILTFAIVLGRVERPERWPVDIFFHPRRSAWRSWSSFRRTRISSPSSGWSHPGILNGNSRYPQHGAGHLPLGGALACWVGTQSGSRAPGAVLALGAVLGTSGAWTCWRRRYPDTRQVPPYHPGRGPGRRRCSSEAWKDKLTRSGRLGGEATPDRRLVLEQDDLVHRRGWEDFGGAKLPTRRATVTEGGQWRNSSRKSPFEAPIWTCSGGNGYLATHKPPYRTLYRVFGKAFYRPRVPC